jgi:zinc transporter ZupT
VSLFLISFAAIAIGSAGIGIWITSIPEVSRKVVPVSGAILILLSIGWVLPELAHEFGWPGGSLLLLGGFGLLWLIDRRLYPVCPSCSHTHDHDHCNTRLHGFATPLIVAALLHSIFDGWALAAGNEGGLGYMITAGIAVHKIPEAIAFGVILRSALKSRGAALGWAVVVQGATVLGGALETWTSSSLGQQWVALLLAVGGGTFLYLGCHALHGEWKRRTAAARRLA